MRLWLRNSNICLETRSWWGVFRRGLLVAMALACAASLAHALDPNLLLAQYMRERWGSDKGFNGGSGTPLAQTPHRYLWIGTEKKMVCFHGFSFPTFSH